MGDGEWSGPILQITNFVEKNIAFTIVYTDNAAMPWKDLEERFNQGNGPLLYQIRYELNNLHQGNDSTSIYFNKLKTIWDNLDSNTKQIIIALVEP